MSPKNAAEIQINRTKAITAITREDRETGRYGEERRPKQAFSLISPGGAPGK
jgi:hypothetical protein